MSRDLNKAGSESVFLLVLFVKSFCEKFQQPIVDPAASDITEMAHWRTQSLSSTKSDNYSECHRALLTYT